MSRSSYRIYDDRYPHFITCNVAGGIPVFAIPETASIILESFRFMQQERQVNLFAYVIMENHLHFIAQSEALGKKTGEFKSFTARKIIDYLKINSHPLWLKKFQEQKDRHKIGRKHQLWQEGYHPKQIIGDSMMTQKIEYIHANPIKRGYVDEPEHWRYSSARNYAGTEGLIPVALVRR